MEPSNYSYRGLCPGCTFFHNLSEFITFAAAPLVLTPFVRNKELAVAQDYPPSEERGIEVKNTFINVGEATMSVFVQAALGVPS